MSRMNRRDFTRLALAGLGTGLFGATLCRAAPFTPPGIAPAPPLTPGIAPALNGVAYTKSIVPSYAALLERAKAALDSHRHRIALHDRVALADFSASSRDMRFHIVDLAGGRATSYLVSHGRGSDPGHSGWLHNFSNVIGSLATSNGAYVTGEVYHGQHGQSMRLSGLDPRNSNAAARAIVVHGADYVSEDFLVRWGKLGRSEGCFAFARHVVPLVIGQLGQGRLLYADKI